MSENLGLIPADVDVAEAQRDMTQLYLLRPPRHVRPLLAQGARHRKPGRRRLKPGP